MITIDQPQQYSIQWEEFMHEVVPEKMGAGELILYWVVEIIRYIPRLIVQAIFKYSVKEMDFKDDRISTVETLFRDHVQLEYKVSPIDISLPDGRCVKATFYEDARSTKATPTIIYFPGMGEMQSSVSANRFASSSTPLNLITFDYPGVGANHEWEVSRENGLLMGLSLYAHLTKNLSLEPSQIHFYGFSLGGAAALDLHRTLPNHKGITVCDRTFSDLYSILSERLGGFLGFITYICLWMLGQDFPSKETLASLPQGKVHILNLLENHDEAIPYAYDLLQNLIPNPNISLKAHRLTPIDSRIANHRTPLSNLLAGEENAFDYIHRELNR